jgi:hypothetical protein
MDDDTLIKALEERLLDPKIRGCREELEKLISPQFIEYGSSGKIYNYPGTLAYLAVHSAEMFQHTFVNFKTRRLSGDIILALYILEIEKNCRINITNRSSLWRLEKDSAGQNTVWRVIFHQGTSVTR